MSSVRVYEQLFFFLKAVSSLIWLTSVRLNWIYSLACSSNWQRLEPVLLALEKNYICCIYVRQWEYLPCVLRRKANKAIRRRRSYTPPAIAIDAASLCLVPWKYPLSLSVCLCGLFRVVLQENVTWLVGYIYMCRCGLDAAPCVHWLPWR